MIAVNPQTLMYRRSFIELLEEGCAHCDFDEAEGGLVDHCDDCCRKITVLAYELFVIQMECPEWSQADRAVKP